MGVHTESTDDDRGVLFNENAATPTGVKQNKSDGEDGGTTGSSVKASVTLLLNSSMLSTMCLAPQYDVFMEKVGRSSNLSHVFGLEREHPPIISYV